MHDGSVVFGSFCWLLQGALLEHEIVRRPLRGARLGDKARIGSGEVGIVCRRPGYEQMVLTMSGCPFV